MFSNLLLNSHRLMATDETMLNHLKKEIPVDKEALLLNPDSSVSLVIVDDVVNGFCTASNTAPTNPDEHISKMVNESARLAREFWIGPSLAGSSL
ncbi:hypothetical protein HA466_0258010 [Hirschfeldia incana]|nr:hypothetical protein HA466_0258010 [Hirschfeldia incana]